jgi:hypothetical protein
MNAVIVIDPASVNSLDTWETKVQLVEWRRVENSLRPRLSF